MISVNERALADAIRRITSAQGNPPVWAEAIAFALSALHERLDVLEELADTVAALQRLSPGLDCASLLDTIANLRRHFPEPWHGEQNGPQ